MSTQNIGMRIDADLLAQVDALAAEQGTSRTFVIVEALHRRLGLAKSSTVEQRLTIVEQRLTIVEQSLGKGAEQRITLSNDQPSMGIPIVKPPAPPTVPIAATPAPPPPPPPPKQPRQNRQQGASSRAQVSGHPTESPGLSIGAALIAAGAEIAEAHAMNSNRDQRMVTRYGVKGREWLEGQGWRVEGRKWYPPVE